MIQRRGPGELLHEVVINNGMIHLAGLVGEGPDIGSQTGSIIDQLEQALTENGSSLTNLVSALIFITDMGNKPAMNEVWKQRIPASCLPTRATIGINDLGRGVLIEVVFTAAIP